MQNALDIKMAVTKIAGCSGAAVTKNACTGRYEIARPLRKSHAPTVTTSRRHYEIAVH
jgi:hypothetical protein